jgi:hypothetical protein
VDATYRATLQLGNCVINCVRYRCEVGHRLQKHGTTLVQQAVFLHALSQTHSLPAVHSDYAAAYSTGYLQYGNGSEYFPTYTQDHAQHYQQYQHQDSAQPYEHQAPASTQAQSQAVSAPMTPARTADPRTCYAYASQQYQVVSPPSHYPPGTTTYTPMPMSPPVFYGSCSPGPYEPQMFAAQFPQVHALAPQQPHHMHAGPYMAASASQQQMGYHSGGALHAPQLAAAHSHQPQQQGQYAAQSQYAYPYIVRSSSTTPTRDYSEMGLRAHSQSFSSGSATASRSASMSPQQVPISTPQASYMNVYMAPQAQQQHAGYASCTPHVVQVQPSMYYLPQQQATVSPRYAYPYVNVPPAANTAENEVSSRSAAPSESVFGVNMPLQAGGDESDTEYSDIGESAPQTPRSAAWLSNSCSEQLGLRLVVDTGLAPPPPSPAAATVGQRVLRFPQMDDVPPPTHPSASSAVLAGCARDAFQCLQAQPQSRYQNQKKGSDADDVAESPQVH